MTHLIFQVRRWRWGAALVVSLLGFGCLAPYSQAHAGYAAVVVDAGTGDIVDEVNADQVNHPASLTKMMTLYLAFEALGSGRVHWDQPLQVSTWAATRAPTRLGLRPGNRVTVRDCVLAMIVLSANDAATVMAEALGGNEASFAAVMTAKARHLGMTNTNFVNASGLPDEDQVTSARDLAKLAMALYRDFPDQYHYFSTRQFLFHGRMIAGHNHLMYRYPGMDGLKTGYTEASGYNLASSAVRDGQRLFGIVMGGQSATARDQLMATLLDNGFAHRATDPVLVAEAAGVGSHTARRLFAGAERVMAALSPIQKAEAETLPNATARPRSRVALRWVSDSAGHGIHRGHLSRSHGIGRIARKTCRSHGHACAVARAARAGGEHD